MANHLKSKDEQQQLALFDAASFLLSPDDIYRTADQKLLESFGKEDRRIERKPAGIHAKALGDYFSIWANTVPDGGLIAIGMEDTGIASGCAGLHPAKLNEIERAGEVFCPDAKWESKRVPVVRPDGSKDFILLIRVYYNDAKVVETVDGNAYTRIGESRKKLSSQEVRELQIDKGQVDLEREPSRIPYPDGFDAGVIQRYADAVRKAGRLDNSHSNEEILEQRRLGRRSRNKFIPNVACALLFATDPVAEFPGCKIRFLRFDGEWEGTGERFNAVKDRWIEGPIPFLISGAEELLESQLREFSRLGSDGKFYTAPEYPKPAWYEAVVNACVHRSYGLRNMNIFIKLFDDRLVIESPGSFPPFVTPENIYDSHHPRNPHLMNALYFMDLVKCANEGTRRMRDTMADMNLPHPEFRQKDMGHASVRVTLRNDIKHRRVWIDFDASTLVGEALSRDLSQDDHRAVNFVAEHRSINVSQFQRLTGRSWKSAKRLLLRLSEKGIFEHIHKADMERDPEAHFVLKDQTVAKALNGRSKS
ncbi:MAG TPA: ATP-binding protein [Bryobacteraceae bacterium]|nr:ATP-binding protein [Bryobacteraceae bacterium]